MMMSVLLIFIFKIILLPLAQSQSKPAFCHICHFVGGYEASITEYQFSVSDLPKRCEAVVYGNYFFDPQSMTEDTYMYTSDEDALRSLADASVPVLMYVGYFYADNWTEILDPTDETSYNNKICPLIDMIKNLKISGIIVGVSDLYDGTVTDLANKIVQFIAKLRTELPNLLIGLPVGANTAYDKITNDALFDFTVTNDAVDVYIVKMFTRGTECNEEILKSGTVITSKDPNVLSLETLRNAVSQSSMDKDKTFAKMLLYVNVNETEGPAGQTYTQYCDSANAGKMCKWCSDTTQKFYDEGAYVKECFHGISIAFLDYDDFKGTCECQKFPATNALFDGWEGAPIQPCAKLDIIK